MGACVVCKSNAVINRQNSASRTIYNCQNCGMFVTSDLAEKEIIEKSNETASFLMSRKAAKKDDIVLISYDKANLDKDYLQMTVEQIAGTFPKSFSGQIDMSLMNLKNLSSFAGDEIKIADMGMAPLFYVRKSTIEALTYTINAMQRSGLIDVNHYGAPLFPLGVIISPRGWERIYEIEQGKTGENILLACIPRKESETADNVRKAVRKTARGCGFDMVDISSVTAAPLAGDGLIAAIKSSKAVICDFSEDSGETYYASAYASALGKACIITCHESSRKKLKIDTSSCGVIFWDKQDTLYLELLNAVKARI